MKYTKLLLVSPAFYPTHGGAGLRFFRYLPLLAKNLVSVDVICGTPKLKKFTREDHQSEWKNAKVGELISTDKISDASIFKNGMCTCMLIVHAGTSGYHEAAPINLEA